MRLCLQENEWCGARGKIDYMMSAVDMWNQTRIVKEVSMYSQETNIEKRGGVLTEWEEKYCPWWLDFPLGKFPASKRLQYEHHEKGLLAHNLEDDTEARKMAATPFTMSPREVEAHPTASIKRKNKRNLSSDREVVEVGDFQAKRRREDLEYKKEKVITKNTVVGSAVICADVVGLFDALRKKENSKEIDAIKDFLVLHAEE